ncbi:hypothetical protein NPS53_08700 [Pseudomonas putida]|uniref:hypothetical protein n=1 Tax=Pseudomonas putida TaxID=303 RepID=UPI002363CB41|nr:hypothetical protein [Pseudomonas putida]MDD2139652.1 hypothetical protein [Pseudomonas putida]HDS1721575.1 hypothetical protein [Pseudomonas putida]
MYTFAHPCAPTVTYTCDLAGSVASYATDHLHEYDVFVVELESAPHGIGIEVVDKESGAPLGIATIH